MRSAAAVVDIEGMPRPPSDSVQIAIRIPKSWQKDADEIAAMISRPGFTASRTDAFRAAIARGFEALRADHEAESKSESKSDSKTRRR